MYPLVITGEAVADRHAEMVLARGAYRVFDTSGPKQLHRSGADTAELRVVRCRGVPLHYPYA
jgi:hypothetical protein